MIKRNKKALETIPQLYQEHSLIISNKTYTVKELNAIFNIHSLSLVESKEELIKYWQMAVETGVSRFISAVDFVFQKKFPKYE